jgi:DNA-binding NarL/FixJ family response regulator
MLLIARGCTNQEIAERLVITSGTAANHVRAILLRLQCSNRTQVALWAAERGLYRNK